MVVVQGQTIDAEIGEGNLDWAEILAACRDAGVLLGVGTDKRFFPAMAEGAREIVDEALGEGWVTGWIEREALPVLCEVGA